MAYWIQIGRRLTIPNQTNTMRLKDKAAPLVTTKEIMPIKSNVTRLFNIICLFSKNGYSFNGSKVDRRFSYSKIDAALHHDRNEEHMNLMPKACRIDTPSAPSGTVQSELFNGSLGLLNGGGSSYNAADAEANQEMADILRRKKKRKRGMRL